jgi:large subunit ribosomal protein L25
MKTIEIKGTLRTELGKKGSAANRAQAQIPCVIYGNGQNIHLSVDAKEAKAFIYTPFVHVVSVNIDGKVYTTILKDIQFHPVKDEALHIDFYEVTPTKPVVLALPVKVVGNSVGVRAGGKLRIVKRNLKVKGLISNMPEVLEVDITNLDVAQSAKVEDLSYENLVLCDNGKTPVVSVMASRVTKGGK